ncbi:hypothetical protein DASC09_008930 [Saccharomycopsis crataegensis]|uniref:Uncharacterized protein n=1 Tax=Saccharomycopsis crataegensis TaxID=43959 RepID=A0AAV5QHD1_9ASCO|nr:hypothetical protein DASC09_008930 [Saccharomycopsis crataegensis]
MSDTAPTSPLSYAAGASITYVTYMALLASGVAIAFWGNNSKSSFLAANKTQKALPLALNFLASGMYQSI